MTAMGERRDMTEFDREAARRAIDTAYQMVEALCQPRGNPGAREWVMSIPARPNHDPDLVIADGLEAGKKALFEIDRLRKEVEDGGEWRTKLCEALGKLLRAEAKVEEMAMALREIGQQSVVRGRGQIATIRVIVNAALRRETRGDKNESTSASLPSAAAPIAKASVQKVGAVLRKAGFERSQWSKSGRIKGWGNHTRGYCVRLHWAGYIEITFIEGSWARGSDDERAARRESELRKMMGALSTAGLIVNRAKPRHGPDKLRVPLAQGGEAEGPRPGTGLGAEHEHPVREADAHTQSREIEPGRPAADAPKENRNG